MKPLEIREGLKRMKRARLRHLLSYLLDRKGTVIRKRLLVEGFWEEEDEVLFKKYRKEELVETITIMLYSLQTAEALSAF